MRCTTYGTTYGTDVLHVRYEQDPTVPSKSTPITLGIGVDMAVLALVVVLAWAM